jgi:5'-deoxynucleotidase YfbR-like HD superfamily hydrolase
MYRVAAIGQYIADHLRADVKVDKDLITKVNLLHDMGNIVKFDFDMYEVMVIAA